MKDYQSNSDKNKEPKDELPPKDLTPVVSGEVSLKPAGIGRKFKNTFLGGDFKNAREYLIADVLLPALRNLVVDTVAKGVDRLVYGENTRRPGPTTYSGRIQYNNPIYREPRLRAVPDQNPVTRWAQGSRQFDDVTIISKSEADAVVEKMIDIVDKYELVSVADLKEILGLPSAHVDNKWGWSHLGSIAVRQVRDGYRISFPPLEEIA